MKIKLFGMLADKAQANEIEVSDVSTKEQLIQKVNNNHPSFNGLEYKVCVNQAISQGDQHISPDDEIALLPPYAGG